MTIMKWRAEYSHPLMLTTDRSDVASTQGDGLVKAQFEKEEEFKHPDD